MNDCDALWSRAPGGYLDAGRFISFLLVVFPRSVDIEVVLLLRAVQLGLG